MTSTPGDETAPPALYDHCVRTYNAMLEDSHQVSSSETSSDDTTTAASTHTILVYEGFLTRLITVKLNLSVPYYTTVRNRLIGMGCIRQLKRGGGTAPSQYEMIYEPTLEAFMRVEPPKIPKQNRFNAQSEQIDNLTARVSDLETWQEAVNDMLAEHFGTEEV